MQRIIYTTKFHCSLCKKDIPTYLYGDSNSSFTKEYESELIDWAKHFHWIDSHRVCAICGKLVTPKDLELSVNDGSIEIHKDYTSEYKPVKQGDSFGNLLIVHRNCLKKV